jgi:DNA replication protein DnaC
MNIDFSKFGVTIQAPGDVDDLFRQSAQARVDEYNRTAGQDDGTGIHCAQCLDRGYIAFLHPDSGTFTIRPCKCHGTRLTVRRLQENGIWERAKRCRLDAFHGDTDTRKAMKSKVEQFIADPAGHWLCLCGQSGAGKTHLCTATFVQLSHKLGLAGQYLLWNAGGRQLKAASMEDPGGLWDKYKTAPLLYIDDLFKGASGPTDADIRLAFELLDYRYNNRLITILSSEMPFPRLMQTDEAIAGRIKELCGPYLVNISPDTTKNYRLYGAGDPLPQQEGRNIHGQQQR